jgi:protein tyrosine/serine phosphatase
MIERALPFEAIDNFRDFGGYPVAGGGRLRMGRLFRSAHHGAATDKDLDLLGSLKIGAIIDFRGPQERAKAPSRRPAAFSAMIYEVEGESGRMSDEMTAAFHRATPEEAQAIFAFSYAYLATTPKMVAAYRAYFQAAVDIDGPSIIHCSAGKDRTGIGAALLMKALGAHDDDIMADYLLTGSLGDIERRKQLNSVKLREMLGEELPDHVAHALAGVSPDFLHGAFNALTQAPGGIEGHLRDALGADSAWRAKAEKLLIE